MACGLDLTTTPEQEQDVMDELDALRAQLDGQRKLNRLLKRSVKASARQRTQAETRLSHISTLRAPLDTLHALPDKFHAMYRTVSSLPPLEVSPTVDLTEPGKRQWETSRSGYVNRALSRLLVRTDEGTGHGAVDKMDSAAASIGDGEALRRALHEVDTVQRDLASVQHQQPSDEPEDDSHMEE
ncbi:hypothetical protein HYPSUDRAFT_201358 [Hypholoma sublateritium FD-334 SS-4]|uniref:Uncharacterized protein n=1 Tax=Hypholoma sublateritium (strain FD-334 SS-4) TaxID=945553 RepID=A0A0D2MI47_HYPSF|nr:hypothetical protein HYPSUDRAFT_201358 [Hypholoma sublateritium FD-334 SS-4]